jgi:hypothetical protein
MTPYCCRLAVAPERRVHPPRTAVLSGRCCQHQAFPSGAPLGVDVVARNQTSPSPLHRDRIRSRLHPHWCLCPTRRPRTPRPPPPAMLPVPATSRSARPPNRHVLRIIMRPHKTNFCVVLLAASTTHPHRPSGTGSALRHRQGTPATARLAPPRLPSSTSQTILCTDLPARAASRATPRYAVIQGLSADAIHDASSKPGVRAKRALPAILPTISAPVPSCCAPQSKNVPLSGLLLRCALRLSTYARARAGRMIVVRSVRMLRR